MLQKTDSSWWRIFFPTLFSSSFFLLFSISSSFYHNYIYKQLVFCFKAKKCALGVLSLLFKQNVHFSLCTYYWLQLSISVEKKEAASRLFATIDWPAAGLISWDELCTYLYLELTQEEYMLMRACRVELYEPPIRKNLPHRDPAIALARVHDGFWVICSQVGALSSQESNNTPPLPS